MAEPSAYDLSAENIHEALVRLREALGEEAVLTDDSRVREFRDPYETAGATAFQPSFVVQPASVEEVQTVLRIANELRIDHPDLIKLRLAHQHRLPGVRRS